MEKEIKLRGALNFKHVWCFLIILTQVVIPKLTTRLKSRLEIKTRLIKWELGLKTELRLNLDFRRNWASACTWVQFKIAYTGLISLIQKSNVFLYKMNHHYEIWHSNLSHRNIEGNLFAKKFSDRKQNYIKVACILTILSTKSSIANYWLAF